jgi:glycosyltransferase involved in cell wall biosynthesis
MTISVARGSIPGSISVIVPVYNGEAHLLGALGSCLAQSRAPHEIIVVNDGSTDGSLAVITAFAASSPIPVRVIDQANAGQSQSRNNGVAAASGEYIAFLDQDDQWRPEFLAEVAKPLDERSQVTWSYCDFDTVDGEGRLLTRGYIRAIGQVHPKLSVIDIIGQDCMVLPSASVMRRQVFEELGGFDARLRGYEDDDLYLRTFQAGWEMAYLPASLIRYRVHSDGSSAQASFRRSRVIFFANVCAVLADDPRRSQWYISDLVLPRLLHTTIMEYSGALNANDFESAQEICATMDVLLQGGRPTPRQRRGVAFMRNPRRAKRIIAWVQRIPVARRVLPLGLFVR